jgi:hypothetical protein
MQLIDAATLCRRIAPIRQQQQVVAEEQPKHRRSGGPRLVDDGSDNALPSKEGPRSNPSVPLFACSKKRAELWSGRWSGARMRQRV